MYFPRRAGKRTPKIVKSQNVRILLIFQWFYSFPYANSMQTTSPMHLNTSPTSFEGSGTGKHEKNTQNLKKLKTCAEKAARIRSCATHNHPSDHNFDGGRRLPPPSLWHFYISLAKFIFGWERGPHPTPLT